MNGSAIALDLIKFGLGHNQLVFTIYVGSIKNICIINLKMCKIENLNMSGN